MKARVSLIILGLAVSLTAAAWAVDAINWKDLGIAFRDFPLWLPFAAVCTYLFSFVPRAYRSRLMLLNACSNPPTAIMAGEAQIMGYAANNMLPLRLGEFVRIYVLKQLAGTPAWTGMTSLLAERILDGAVMILILGISISWFTSSGDTFSGSSVEKLLETGLILFALAFAGLLFVAAAKPLILRSSKQLLPTKYHNSLSKVLAALAFFRKPKTTILVVSLSFAIWIIEGSVFGMVISCMGIGKPWETGMLVLAVVNLGILLPSAPGYIGVFQACGVLAFQSLGHTDEQGLAMSIVVHGCQFIPLTAIGLMLTARHGWNLSLMTKSQSTT